jgi:flagellar hook-length control protein FliK
MSQLTAIPQIAPALGADGGLPARARSRSGDDGSRFADVLARQTRTAPSPLRPEANHGADVARSDTREVPAAGIRPGSARAKQQPARSAAADVAGPTAPVNAPADGAPTSQPALASATPAGGSVAAPSEVQIPASAALEGDQTGPAGTGTGGATGSVTGTVDVSQLGTPAAADEDQPAVGTDSAAGAPGGGQQAASAVPVPGADATASLPGAVAVTAPNTGASDAGQAQVAAGGPVGTASPTGNQPQNGVGSSVSEAPQPALPSSVPVETAAAPLTAEATSGAIEGAPAQQPATPTASAAPAAPASVPAPPAIAQPGLAPAGMIPPALSSSALAASAATPAAAPTPPSLPQQLVPRIASVRALGDGVHRLTLRVEPEAIGAVRVVAEVRGDAVRLELFGGTEAAREALRAALPDLRRDLAGTGLQAQLDLGSSTDRQPGDRTGRSFSGEQPTGTRQDVPARPHPTPTGPQRASGPGRLDVLA